MNKIKRIINFILSKFGYEIIPTIKQDVLNSLKVDRIIDVGVHHGTDFLIKFYPDAYFYLVELEPQIPPFIEKHLLKKITGELIPYGCSDRNCNLNFDINNDESRISISNTEHTIECKTLDNIFQGEIIENVLLKIDVEGHEFSVLKGE